MNKTRLLVFSALFVSMEIVLTRFLTYQTPYIRIGFGFFPIALSAVMFGPVVAGLTAGLSDVLRMMIFPTGFPYFPGFTFSAFLTGALYGIFLYSRPKSLVRVLLAVTSVTFLVDIGLNTIWLSMLWKEGFLVLLPGRLLKSILMIPIQVSMLLPVNRLIFTYLKARM